MRLQIFTIKNASSNHIFVALFKIMSIFNKDRHYYLQAFLKECKYIENEKKNVNRFIGDDLDFFSL